MTYYVIKQCKLNKSMPLCGSGKGSLCNKHAEQIIWAVISFVSSQLVLQTNVSQWTVFWDLVNFLTLRAEIGLKAVTTSAWSLRATEQVDPRLDDSYSGSVLSNVGRNTKASDCGFSWCITSISRWLRRNYLKLGRCRCHPCHFQFLYLLSYSDLFPPIHCRCRGLFFYLITLGNKHTHTHLVWLWTKERPVAETSTWQHTFTTDGRQCPRWYSKPQTQQATGPSLRPRGHRDRPFH